MKLTLSVECKLYVRERIAMDYGVKIDLDSGHDTNLEILILSLNIITEMSLDLY